MNKVVGSPLSRRGLLTGGGCLIVGFTLLPVVNSPAQQAAPTTPRLPGDLNTNPMLDAWIRVDADNTITVFTGKAELGQGTKTSILQIAAEFLDADPKAITLITADTGLSPNEGYTAGSQTMPSGGTAVMHAAAQARTIIVDLAAQKWGVPADGLVTANATVTAPDGRSAKYGELVAADTLHAHAQPTSNLKDPKTYKVVGTSLPRVDIPAKVTGGSAFIQDLRLPGMVHARVVRPPRYGARLKDFDVSVVEKMPGVIKVVRNGSYLAVVAERQFEAIGAMSALADSAKWDMGPELPANLTAVVDMMKAAPAQVDVIVDRPLGVPIKTIEATYQRPYFMHGSIGPSCGVAHLQDGKLTVWSHTQGVFPDRQAIAELVGMSQESVRVIHAEGAGCYGHNGADDAAADAALIAKELPGRPVRVQWMRAQEHGWEPYGTAMTTTMRGGVDAAGNVVAWDYNFWSMTHGTRPGGAGSLIAGWLVEKPFALPKPTFAPSPSGSADRNATPYYKFPGEKVTSHFVFDMPVRISALRGLGAYMNVFSIESFMDELAVAADADPVEFRLKHLDDPRAIAVVKMAAEKFGWRAGAKAPKNHGYGFSFARYENLGAYLAMAMEIAIEPGTGRIRIVRVVAADDSGTAVNPDAIKNQIQGGILQSASWTLYESVNFDKNGINSVDWRSYPIMRFPDVPGSIEVYVIDHPGLPYLGTGEASQGPTGPAIANAIYNAAGVRLRSPPFTRELIKSTIRA